MKPLNEIMDKLQEHDLTTYKHCKRVGGKMAKIAKATKNYEELWQQVGLYHDIGKIRINQKILQKPGPLMKFEREIINRHPRLGYEIIHPYNPEIAEVIVAHHEFQELPYPRQTPRFRNEKIKELAFALAICDFEDALRNQRPYKPSKDNPYVHIALHNAFGPVVNQYLRIIDREVR